ncbi:MAG: ABC transporter permease subunit [Halobacteriales archaeon]|nr:ABC transporter permease subunit [Halobacteriales archaeon]
MSAAGTLLVTNLRAWMGAKGFAMVLVAALAPVLLTGAWLATHNSDVSATNVLVPSTLTEGQNVTFTADIVNLKGDVSAFNATLSVGRVFGNTLSPSATNTVLIDHMRSGEKRAIQLNWTAQPGVYYVLAEADSSDDIGEVEEFNNQVPLPVAVHYVVPTAASGPAAPAGLAGSANSTGTYDVAVTDLSIPSSAKPGDSATFTATFTNRGTAAFDGNGTLRVGRMFGTQFAALKDISKNLTLAPGASDTVSFTWNVQEGALWAEAYANGTAGRDTSPADNHVAKAFTVDPALAPDATPPTPPQRLTIKDFYLQILSLLHLRVLLPLVALFYAAGVLADEKERGTLPFILTRAERWTLPVTKFIAGYAVAAVAVVLGIVVTYLLLFGQPSTDPGFLVTPLLVSLLTLFVYGCLFTLLGVLVDRPYLIGVAFVIGWETIVSLFVPPVRQFTLNQHILEAVGGWSLNSVQWLPTGEGPMRALLLLLAAGAVFLGASAMWMKQREFDV